MHVLGAHVDGALEPEPRGHRRHGDAVLAGTGFGDQALLAHTQREQRLPQRVVELVRAGMAQVLALEVDVRTAEVLAEPRRRVERSRPAHKGVPMAGELELELRVGLRLVPQALQLLERAHESLGHVLPAKRPEPPPNGMTHARAAPPHQVGRSAPPHHVGRSARRAGWGRWLIPYLQPWLRE